MRKILSIITLIGFALAGCNQDLDRPVQENTVFTEDLLRAPTLDVDSTAPPVFHPILSRENYDSILQMNDLSYAVANEFGFTQGQPYPTQENIGAIRSRIQSISESLTAQGWSPRQNISGRTGRNNVDPDITAITYTHAAQRLIVVTFHGSRSGNRDPRDHDGRGDWGSNHDPEPVTPSSIGIPEFPDQIRVHRGFANNLASAREPLLADIDQRLDVLGPGPEAWVLLSGHSRGAALAALATGLVRVHLTAQGARFAHVKVGGVLFSTPRAVQGDQSQTWFHTTVGRANLFRINVHGDPVTVTPSRPGAGYRSLGTLFLDSIWAVNMRTRQTYGTRTYGWSNADEIANFHYGCGLRGLGFEFDPHVVMRYADLPGGFQEGRFHLRNRSN